MKPVASVNQGSRLLKSVPVDGSYTVLRKAWGYRCSEGNLGAESFQDGGELRTSTTFATLRAPVISI